MNEKITVTDRIKIYRRGKKGFYCAEFHFHGQHRRESLRTSNLKEAKIQALELDHLIRGGEYQERKNKARIDITITKFLEHKRMEKRAPRTLTRYTGELETIKTFFLKQKVILLERISATLIDEYRSERLKTKQMSTVNHESELLRQFLSWSVSRKLLIDNPMKLMKFSHPKRDPQPALKCTPLVQVLNLATPRLQILLSTLLMTGMRIGELQHLRHEDVDFESGWIHVMSRPGAETKTKCSRKIPMHPHLRTILEKKSHSPGVWFFCAEPSDRYPDGDHTITPKRINEEFQSLLKRCSIVVGRKSRGFTLHSLRHCFETVCVNEKIPTVLVDRWMGHSSRGSMGTIYYDDDEERAHQLMQEVNFPRFVNGIWQ